jgi:TLD
MPQRHQRHPRINQQLVNFLALKLRDELGFRVPIFFQVFLIIQLFRFPAGFIQSNRRQYKAAKLTILKSVLRKYLSDAGCLNLQMQTWWDNSHPLHRHRFLEAIYNNGCFKPWTFKLLYSTALHGFSNSTFHQLCDKKGPTITIMTLNGNIVVAVLEKSWYTQYALNLGYQEDKSCKMFHVTSTGEIVKLRCSGFYNYHSYGPDFKFLHVNLDRKQADSCFPKNNKCITGYNNYSFARIDSVVVLKISIFFDSFPSSLLTQIARATAPFLPIGDV